MKLSYLLNGIMTSRDMTSLDKIPTKFMKPFESEDSARAETGVILDRLSDLHNLMYAESRRSVLIIFQGIDASGKDGAIKKLAQGLNPQGCRVYSFKSPSAEELNHDFIWRCHNVAPARGNFAVFNRSYYEEVTSVYIHREYLEAQNLPREIIKQKDFFQRRYEHINAFEKMLSDNGTVVLKFYLHISKTEQKRRLEERMQDPKKNWKYSPGDWKDRKSWGAFMNVYEKMIRSTATEVAPWYIIPADHKWYRDYLVSRITAEKLGELKMEYPKLTKELRKKRQG